MSRPPSSEYKKRNAYNFLWFVTHWMEESRFVHNGIFPSHVVHHFGCTWLEAELVLRWALQYGRITRNKSGRYFVVRKTEDRMSQANQSFERCGANYTASFVPASHEAFITMALYCERPKEHPAGNHIASLRDGQGNVVVALKWENAKAAAS